MKEKLNTLRNLALGAGVVFALFFGATQAWAKDDPCTLPPEYACAGEPDPDAYCSYWCDYYEYPPFGHCLIQEDCCTCPEK